MAFSVTRSIRTRSLPHNWLQRRSLRSDTALEAIVRASEDQTPFIALYNYPSFSGALSALFAHLFHSRLSLPCLFLPFSSVLPLRTDDLRIIGIEKCYLLDFVGPPGFALQLSRTTNCEVICFDHRKSTLQAIQSPESCLEKVKFHVDVEKSSSRAVYEYFSSELKQNQKVSSVLLDSKDQERVELLLNYIEDVDLRRWRLADINAFKNGIGEWRSRMNCITNPLMFDQLMELSVEELVSNGNSLIQPCKDAAKDVLDKAFKLRLGKGIYGECLAVRADGNSHVSDEIGKELSLRSCAAGLRPIGAVIYMQRNNLKMCLRSMDSSSDTSEIAKPMELSVEELVSNGNSLIRPCKDAAKDVLDKAFKLRLGKGIYGECLAVKADGNSHLSDEIGKELILRSSAAGLRVICFDHRKSTLQAIQSPESCLEKVKFHIDVEKRSSRAVYEYFSSELKQNQVGSVLLDSKDQERVELLLNYIEDVDLRRWRLADINAFKNGIGERRSRMNCITNPFMFDQLMELSVEELVSNGNLLIQPCKDAAKDMLDKAFKLRLGKGIYGECLAVRADGNSHLSDEIGKELSLRSSAAGLRPIGAVIYMQRNNLKMCLRSTDSSSDTSEIAKAYGGGGRPNSSSFIIRMDEYNQWLPINASLKYN